MVAPSIHLVVEEGNVEKRLSPFPFGHVPMGLRYDGHLRMNTYKHTIRNGNDTGGVKSEDREERQPKRNKCIPYSFWNGRICGGYALNSIRNSNRMPRGSKLL